ncbi:WD40/YVTN repeat-like containing protein [Gracilaria domingensis]|nr:WD40/YVTN repeat-like containing protein [Gracilaria domingensis]
MPNTGNSLVASAGLDQQVHLTNVETSKSLRWICHTDSVKTVAPLDANVFITASKDGTSRLFDARIPPTAHPSDSSIIVVNIPCTNPFSNGINSAIPSPVFPNHILVSSGDPYLRIFDLRFNTSNRLNSPRISQLKSRTTCIESYCPSHLYELAPERCSPSDLMHPAYVTFATFSTDANQIVASYYMDAVHVFNRRQQSQSVPYSPGFRFKSERKRVVWLLIQEAAERLLNGSVSCAKTAIAKANRVLELEPQNILALLYKAESLLLRENYSDFREAFETLQLLINLVRERPQRITALWGSNGPMCPPCFPESVGKWELKAKIWLMIFEFQQIRAMYRMIPYSPVGVLQPGVNGLVTRRRFEHLRELCSELMERRWKLFSKRPSSNGHKTADAPGSMYDCSLLRDDIYREALGTEEESSRLYSTESSRLRKQILVRLVEKLASSKLNMLLFAFDEKIADLEPHNPNSQTNRRLASAKEYWVRVMNQDHIPHHFARELKALEAEEKRLLAGFDSEALWGVRPRKELPCKRYHGHQSEKTDIKEARFYGADNQVVLSGSDDGFVYMWSAGTCELLTRVSADDQIVNCVLPHPYRSMVLVSGIDSTIKVLTPDLSSSEE